MDSDFNSLTGFQNDLHGLELNGTTLNYKDKADIGSLVRPIADTITYHDPHPEPMNVTITGNKAIAEVNMKHTHLAAMHVRRFIPGIKVKKEFEKRVQIAWTYNLGTNSWTKIEEKWDNDARDTLENRGHDSLLETYQGKNAEDKSDLSGNNDDFLEWSTELQEDTIEVTPLWSWYRGGTTTARPLWLIAPQKMLFVIHLRNKIADLLRMKIFDEKTNRWEIRKPILSYLGLEESTVLPAIEVFGTYIDVLPSELEKLVKEAECSGTNGIVASYRLDTLLSMDKSEVYTYGQAPEFEPPFDFPGRVIIATAENIDATETNCHSNYTTNPIDIFAGKSPIASVTILNQKTNTEIVYDSITMRRYRSMLFPRVPKIAGHEFVPRSVRPTDVECANGTSLKNNNIKIIVKLGEPQKGATRIPQKFKVSLRIQVVRRFTCRLDKGNKFKWEFE
jgi:hypothetical protein